MSTTTARRKPANWSLVVPGPDDFEEWRPVEGWIGYDISNWGRTRSYWGADPEMRRNGAGKGRRTLLDTTKIVGGYVMASGHIQCALYLPGELKPKRFAVHDLVLTTFVGPRPDGAVGRHLDGNPGNNRVSNLAWGTYAENQIDRIRHGSPTAKLREEDVPAIWARLVSGESAPSISRDYGVASSTITQLRNGVQWSHITSKLSGWPLADPNRKDRKPVSVPPEFCGGVEVWRDHHDSNLYRISNHGRAITLWTKRGKVGTEWREIIPYTEKDGYLIFHMRLGERRRNCFIHKSVLSAFAGPRPEGMVACHNDGDKLNNRAENLRWDTPSANALDRVKHRGR